MRGRRLFSIQVLAQICGNLREDKKIYPDPAINRLPGTCGRGRTLVSLAAVPSLLICPQWQRSPHIVHFIDYPNGAQNRVRMCPSNSCRT